MQDVMKIFFLKLLKYPHEKNVYRVNVNIYKHKVSATGNFTVNDRVGKGAEFKHHGKLVATTKQQQQKHYICVYTI